MVFIYFLVFGIEWKGIEMIVDLFLLFVLILDREVSREDFSLCLTKNFVGVRFFSWFYRKSYSSYIFWICSINEVSIDKIIDFDWFLRYSTYNKSTFTCSKFIRSKRSVDFVFEFIFNIIFLLSEVMNVKKVNLIWSRRKSVGLLSTFAIASTDFDWSLETSGFCFC